VRGVRCRNSEHETRGRNDAVVRTQYRCAQPANAAGTVALDVAQCHSCSLPVECSVQASRESSISVSMRCRNPLALASSTMHFDPARRS
jgi:hypothetical protein